MSEAQNGGLIYKLIPQMIREVEHIAKDRKNQQQGFNYRGVDDVYNAVHPLLAKFGVFMAAEILDNEREERTNAKGTVLFYQRIRTRYRFFAEDGSSVTTEALGEGMDSGDKASNKAQSIAFKYALFQLLCIPTMAVDPDGERPELDERGQGGIRPQEQARRLAKQAGATTGDKIPPKTPEDKYTHYSKILANCWTPDWLTRALDKIAQENDKALSEQLDIAMQAATRRAEILTAESLDDEEVTILCDQMEKTGNAALEDQRNLNSLIAWRTELWALDPNPCTQEQSQKLDRCYQRQVRKGQKGAA